MLIARADVMTDWWAVHSTESPNHGLDVRLRLCCKVAPNFQPFRWQCLETPRVDRIQRSYGPLYLPKSGTHPSFRHFGHALEEAVAAGLVPEARVNVSTFHNFLALVTLHLRIWPRGSSLLGSF